MLAGHANPYYKSSRLSNKNEEYKHKLPLLGALLAVHKGAMISFSVHNAASVLQRHSSTKQQMLDEGSVTPTMTFSQALPFSHE